MTERRRPAKLPAWPVAAGAAGTFLAALAFLAGQVRDGRDPALGPAVPVAAHQQPREIVVRKIIRRIVITHPAPRPAASAAPPPVPVAAPSAPVPSAPVQSAPVQSAPAPAPVVSAPAPAPPAPAPARAPLTTRSS
jgi:hypothetical protein